MLEGVVARILNQLLGKYVLDLDTENLNVGIFSGSVQLCDLKLKTEALYELQLPIQVRAGTIGRISLQIPWSTLWNQPILVNIEDIHILCKPIVGEPYNAEENKRLLRGFKKKTLETLADSSACPFSEHLFSNIVNNIQLMINNVHIRYECNLHNLPIAIGLCIGSISTANTTSKWKPYSTGYKSNDNLFYHLIKVEALCTYCNGYTGDSPPEWDLSTSNGYYQWKNSMSSSLQNYAMGSDFNFLLRPMSVKLKMTITKEHGQMKKIVCDCVVHDLNIHLDRNQCRWLLSVNDSLQRAYIAWNYLQFRPSEPPISTNGAGTKPWWQYAYKAVLLQSVHPYTWSQIRQVRQNQKFYTELYQRHLLNPNDTELKLDLQQYEDKLNITNLIIARQVARLRTRTQSLQTKSVWDSLPSPEKQVLCERIGFNGQRTDTFPTIEYEYNFRIGNTCITLTNESEREVLVLTLTQFISSYRPGETLATRRRDIGSIRAEGIIIEGANQKEHLIPLLSSNHEGHDSPAFFLRFDWESYPESRTRIDEEELIKMRVNLVLEQLEFVFDKYAYEQILNYMDHHCFFGTECVGSLSKLPTRIYNSMDKLLLDNWDFNIVLSFPYFVIPQNITLQNKNCTLIIDPGRLKLSTELCQPLLIADNATQMELEEQMYSKYHFEFKDQQILFVTNDRDNWKAAKRERDTELHLLPKSSSTLTYCSCIKKIKTLPEQKLNWNLQSFKVNFSEKKILTLIAFIETFDYLELWKEQFKNKSVVLFQRYEDKETVYLRSIQSGVILHDGLTRKRQTSGLRKQQSVIDKKIELHEKNANVNEAWARCVDLPGLEDNISPTNTIRMIFRIVLNEFQVSYSRSSDTTDTPYLNLRLGLITIDLALMTYGPAYQFSIGNLILADKMHTTHSGQYLDLLHSPFPSTVDVFAMMYRKVGANCPDFWTHFHGVETSLVADLGTLNIMLHQEAVRTLIQYWKYIRDTMIGVSYTLTYSLFEKWLKTPLLAYQQTYFATKVPVPTGSIKYSQSGRLGDLNVRIVDSDFDILNVHLEGFEMDFIFRANERFVFRSFLSSINVEHLCDASLYKKILYTDEDQVFELKYVRFAELKESEASSFKFHLGQLYITLLYKLFIQSHRFTINLGLGEFCQRLLRIAEQLINKATESLKTNSKINLIVNVKGPVLLIPQKSSSPNVLIVDSGNLSIENFFKDTHQETIENILVKISDTFLSRGVINLNGSLGRQETIMEPLGVHLDVKRIIPKVKSITTLTWEVDGLVDTIHITLGQKDITMLLAIYSDNKTDYEPQAYPEYFGFVSKQTSVEDESLRNLEVFFVEPKQKSVSVILSCDGVNISFFFDSGELLSSPIRDLNHGFVKLQIEEISESCILYSDRSMDGKLSVGNVLLEEIGSNTNVGDTRILHSPLDEHKNNNCMITVNKPPIIDLTLHRNQTQDNSVDIIIGRLAFTLSIPLLEKVALFVIDSIPKDQDAFGEVNHGYVDAERYLEVRPASRKSLTIALRVNKPEFLFLIEDVTNSKAYFVTRAEILSDYSRHSQRENFVFSLSGLHTLYCSSKEDTYVILRQCDAELSQAVSDERGEQLNLTVSSLYFQFSNRVVYAINSSLNDIAEHFKVSDHNLEPHQPDAEIKDLWEPRKVVIDYPSKNNSGTSPLKDFLFGQKVRRPLQSSNNHQLFHMPRTELLLVLQLDTLPVLIFKSTLELTISDWSSQINANCEITIQGNYFNTGKQKWEPFIDPVVVEENVYRPWKLNARIFHDSAHEMAKYKRFEIGKRRAGRSKEPKKVLRPKKDSNASESTGEEDDDSCDDMMYLEPTNSFHARKNRRVKTSLSTFLDETSDSENDDGSMEKLAAAISALFTGDWNESEESDVDNSTGSDPDPEDPVVLKESPTIQHSPNKSLYILFESKDILNITLTPAFAKIMTDVMTQYSNKTVSLTPAGGESQLINLTNDIGPKSKVEVYEKEHLGTPVSRISETDCKLVITKTYEKEDSYPNSPSKEVHSSLVSDFEEFEYNNTQNFETDLSYDFATVNSLEFTAESTRELYERINRYQMKIFIPHFYGLQTACPRKDAQKLLRLHPSQVSTTIYYLAYRSTLTKHGMSIIVSSPLSIRNETCFALSVLYQPSILQQLNLEPVGEVTNPFETTMRIAVLEPHETYNVPIHIAYHCKLFIQPAYAESQYLPSHKGVWWKDMAIDMDAGRLLQCQAKNNGHDLFSLRVVLQPNLTDTVAVKHTVPNYVIRLLPAIIVNNYLPYAITVDLLDNKPVKIEPGERSCYYNIDTSQTNRFSFKLQTYQQYVYIGGLSVNPNFHEKVIALVANSEMTDSNDLLLNIKAERADYYQLSLYASYWIVNKTHLALQVKATSTNTILKSTPTNQANHDIILFSFKRNARHTVKLKVHDSEFSNDFGLDCPGTSGLVVCKDIVRKKKYSILLKVTLSEMNPLTKIVTFLPCFIVCNQTNKKLRFMEHNDKTDFWIDLQANQEIPFWPETSSYQMYVKLEDQKTGSSQAFYFSQRHKTLLKLEKLGALTVTVSGDAEHSFKVKFSNYREGDASLLIKNTCNELFLKVQQQGVSQVTLLSPQNEIVYTWDDPCKNRILIWNIYNNKSTNGFLLDLEKSAINERFQYGKERIYFGVGNPQTTSSNDDSDSSSEESATSSKMTIYWIVYYIRMTKQRALLFTQDTLMFSEYLQMAYGEMSMLEVLVSLTSIGLSIFNSRGEHKHKEHFYLSLNDCPATWEVNVGHKWKTLTLELASWIEDMYWSNEKRCQLKDYVHIDFEKMFMLKPFFAELRRSYNPAVCLQYRRGVQNQYVRLQIQNIQLDNKSVCNQEAIVFNQIPATVSELTKENVKNPFVNFSMLKEGLVVKYIELNVKDIQMNLQCEFFMDLEEFFPLRSTASEFRKDMSKILNNKSKHLDPHEFLLIEHMKTSSINVLLYVQSSHSKGRINRWQEFLFPTNITPYMPSEGVRHKVLNLELNQVYCKSMRQCLKQFGQHFKTQFLQQYYAQVLGLQVLVNPFAAIHSIDSEFTGHVQNVHEQSNNLLHSFRCLLGYVNMSSVAVEQCIMETLNGQHNFLRRPINNYQQLQTPTSSKIINWSTRNFNPGVILALSQIVASKNPANCGQSDGEVFFRGTGKALISLLTRHLGDKANSVQVTIEALKRAAILGESIRCHRRLTRYANKYLGLTPFSIYNSMGYHLVETVAGGRFQADTYWSYAGIDGNGRSIIIIVTLEHILRINKCRLWGAWDLEWCLDLDEIISVPKVTNSKLIFDIRSENEKHDDLAINSEGQLIIEGDEEALVFLQDMIEQAIIVSMEDKAWTIDEM